MGEAIIVFIIIGLISIFAVKGILAIGHAFGIWKEHKIEFDLENAHPPRIGFWFPIDFDGK